MRWALGKYRKKQTAKPLDIIISDNPRASTRTTLQQTKRGPLEASEGAEGKSDKRAILSERNAMERV